MNHKVPKIILKMLLVKNTIISFFKHKNVIMDLKHTRIYYLKSISLNVLLCSFFIFDKVNKFFFMSSFQTMLPV